MLHRQVHLVGYDFSVLTNLRVDGVFQDVLTMWNTQDLLQCPWDGLSSMSTRWLQKEGINR